MIDSMALSLAKDMTKKKDELINRALGIYFKGDGWDAYGITGQCSCEVRDGVETFICQGVPVIMFMQPSFRQEVNDLKVEFRCDMKYKILVSEDDQPNNTNK